MAHGPMPRVGIDLVRVSRIAESLAKFGDRFLRRIFTETEIAYALEAPERSAERLAARFAAKEAAIKALRLADAGVTLRDVEIRRTQTGECEVVLHGRARALAERAQTGPIALSLSHEGDYATAVVVTSQPQLHEP
ncbi:MAG: holo-ACP synthase [Gemmatimonadales bacterium]